MATITVRGEATASGTPDEAVISVELTALRSTPEEAYEDVAERSAALTTVLDELDVPSEARTTAGVTLREQRDYVGGEYLHRGYQATNTVTLTLTSQASVARLLREAVLRADARLEGPWWRLRSDNPARLEACRRAALVARQRCEAYADALGLRLGAVVDVSEPGVASPRHQPEGHMRAMASADMESAPEIGVGAGELDVHAAVEVTYALEPA